MLIRKLTNDEIPQAVDLMIDCWEHDYKGVIPPNSKNREQELRYITSWINDVCDNDYRRRLYGAFNGDVLAGFVGASLAEKEDSENGVEINYLFVNKGYRGKHIGVSLMKEIAVEFNEYGVEQVVIYNWHDVASNEFYRYLGGTVARQMIQTPQGKEALVDIFIWDIESLIERLNEKPQV